MITRDLSYRREVSWRDFFAALRAHAWIGWKWGLLNLVVVGFFLVNFLFYSSLLGTTATLLTALLLGLFILWALVQMYCYPILLEQTELRIGWALRNAFVLLVKYPLFAFSHALVAATFVFMSVVVPYFWMLFTTALLLFIYNHAVRLLMRLERGEDPFEDDPAAA